MRRTVVLIGALITLCAPSMTARAVAQTFGPPGRAERGSTLRGDTDPEMLRRVRERLEPGSRDWVEATRRLAAALAQECYAHPESDDPTCREAATLYGEALDAGTPIPRLDELLYDYGMVLGWLGETAASARLWERLIDEFPHSASRPFAALGLGEYYFSETTDLVSARRYLGEAASTEGFPGRYYALYLDAWCALNLDEPQEALDSLTAAIRATESGDRGSQEARAQMLLDLPLFYAHAGDPASAMAFFQSLAPQEAMTLLARTAEVLDELGRAEDAAIVRSQAPQE